MDVIWILRMIGKEGEVARCLYRVSFKWEVKLAIKQGVNHNFLRNNMSVLIKEYHCCNPFVWCV